MIRPATTLNSSNSSATDLLKLLRAVSQPVLPQPPRVNVAGVTPLVGTGPLGAIKDPTANSAMSIVQLGQAQSEAERLAAGEQEEVLGEASERANIQTVLQEYAANNAEDAETTHPEVRPEVSAATAAAVEQDAGSPAAVLAQTVTADPALQLAMTEPYLFIPNAVHLQQASAKHRLRAKKARASWRFVLRKNDDLDD